MKKLLVVLTALAFVVGFSTVSFAAGISGTDHDFSAKGWNSTGEICVVCHTPHNAQTIADAPLWNHALTTQTFALYTSGTLDATVGQPDGVSKLCLSCHDGTVGLEAFGDTTTGSNFVTGSALVGTDLSNDHPISFPYDAALATTDGGLFNPTTANSGLGGTINADLLFATNVECASCHDVHDNTIQPFLRISNASSELCLTCHDK